MDDHPLTIRPMTPDDCDRVAEIRVGGWRAAYRGMVPQTYLDAMDVAREAERRRAHLAGAGDAVVNLVAEEDGRVVGWGCHGPYRDHDGTRPEAAELYALYVDPARIGTGAGRALLTESVRRCALAGHRRMLLWVLRDNARARRFYARAGFGPDGAEEPFEVGGVAVPEVRYARALTSG